MNSTTNTKADIEEAKASVREAFDVMACALVNVRALLARDERQNRRAIMTIGKVIALMHSTKDLTEAVFGSSSASAGLDRKSASVRMISACVRSKR